MRGVAGAGRKKGEGLWELVKTLEEEEEGLEVFLPDRKTTSAGVFRKTNQSNFTTPGRVPRVKTRAPQRLPKCGPH